MLPVGPFGLAVKMYLLPTAGSNRLGGLDAQPLAIDLGGHLLPGRGDVVLEPHKGAVGSIRGRAQRPKEGQELWPAATTG
jgi:hypothetical protein